MRFVMNKNKTTKKTDAYVKLMLYCIRRSKKDAGALKRGHPAS